MSAQGTTTGDRPGALVQFVLKGYPRLSETFIAQEIRALELAGVRLGIVSLRRPTDATVHPVHREIGVPVSYLPEYLYEEPARVLAAWRTVRRRPTYARCWRQWLRDLRRDPTPNRVRRFGQALVLAHELPVGTRHLHAHFLHTPASVVRYAAILTGLTWSFSAHAKDIWTTPDWDLREKMAECAWGVTCTAANLAHLRALASTPARIELVYHGLDLARFAPGAGGYADRDGGDAATPVRLLSVGRAVEKKGYDILIDALASLPASLCWRLDHVGGGGLGDALRRRAARAGIADRMQWHGALAQDEVLALYRTADLFVLASRVAADGDRDGLPNVLMEAQSQGLACLATRVSAIPELIEAGVSGALVEPEDAGALAAALERLIRAPEERARLGAEGERRVRSMFSLDASVAPLVARFGATGGGDPRPATGAGEPVAAAR